MKLASQSQPASTLTLGLASLFLLAQPSLAAAQTTDHAQHMQSMPDMQMPMQPATKKPAPTENATSTANARKPSCKELAAQGKQASKQYTAQCKKHPKQTGKGAKATAAPAMDHSKMQHTDASGTHGMDHSKMPEMDHSKMPAVKHPTTPAMDHSKTQQSGMEGMQGMDHSGMQAMDPAMKGMDRSNMQGTDSSSMDGMKGMDHSAMEMDHGQMDMSGKDAGAMDMGSMDMSSMNMQGGPPPADARDPDYSDGLDHGPMRGMDMADDAKHLYVMFDNLEYRHSGDGNAQTVDAQAWYGGDHNKLWLKLDGERSNGHLDATRTEALWNHAIATYWGSQVGVRHDLGDGPTRNWAAFGVQGLAPYWFDLQATAYLGQSGRTALRVEAEYELLLTQRWILQPDVEVNFYGKNDPARGIGSGLSDLDVGLRLRYEITRKFAPYVGVVWNRKFGQTADYARAIGGDNQETQLVAGFRIWF